jgi:hypothetical protein
MMVPARVVEMPATINAVNKSKTFCRFIRVDGDVVSLGRQAYGALSTLGFGDPISDLIHTLISLNFNQFILSVHIKLCTALPSSFSASLCVLCSAIRQNCHKPRRFSIAHVLPSSPRDGVGRGSRRGASQLHAANAPPLTFYLTLDTESS